MLLVRQGCKGICFGWISLKRQMRGAEDYATSRKGMREGRGVYMALEDMDAAAAARHDEACGCLKPHSRMFLNNSPCCVYHAASVMNIL
jgi:hypothetical protein